MSAPIPTPAEAEAALRDAKLKAACGLEYAVNLMNNTRGHRQHQQQEQRGAGFKLVINLNSSTQTLQNTEVEVLDVEFTPEPDEKSPSYLVNRSETAEMLAAL